MSPAPGAAPRAGAAAAEISSDPGRDSGRDPGRDLAAGVLWMVGCLFSFLGMAIASRELARNLPVFEIQFFRSLVGLLILLVLVRGLVAQLRASTGLGRQVARNVVHFAAGCCWTLGIALMPLARVVALEFTIPIWVALFAWAMLGERPGPARIAGILAGFAGVLVILQPGAEGFEPAALVVIAAAIGYALSNVMVKQMTLTTAPIVIVAWMVVLQLPMGGIAALLTDWRAPGWADLPWIVLLGITGLSAHYTMAQGLRLMDASVAIPIDFFRVPMTAVAGWLLYAEPLRAATFLGAGLIFAGNFGAMWWEARRRRA